jgi:SH3 domain-containing YSC84-like protein 1
VQLLWYVGNGSTSLERLERLERSLHDNQWQVRWILRERAITASQKLSVCRLHLGLRPQSRRLSFDTDGARIRQMPGSRPMRKVAVFVIVIFLAFPTFAADESREQKRLEACGQVFKEILDIPDGIPKELLNKAECVIVIPTVLKFAIGVGGDFGRGAITCRTGQHFTGHWSAPALFALEGANIGFQLGGEATDFVLLVMNPKGANSILGSKVKLGADASAAAGPKGRAAAADTDIVMRAEILSYSRSRGLFAGISLEGSTLRSDGSANKKLYGRSVTAKEIVRQSKVGVPASGRELISLLDKKSPKNESDPVSLTE